MVVVSRGSLVVDDTPPAAAVVVHTERASPPPLLLQLAMAGTGTGTGTGVGGSGDQGPGAAAAAAGGFYIKFHSNMSIEDLLLLNNYSDNYDDWKIDWNVLHDERWKATVVIIYVLVIIFGFVANVLIVVVIIRYRQLHTVTNVFIVGLGLADIALCVFNLPLQLHYQLNDNWAFGSVLCRVAMTTFGVPMFSSSVFIFMIAVDRYLLIVYPFKKRMTVGCAVGLALLIVAVTTGMSVPMITYTHLRVVEEELVKMHKIVCMETWPTLAAKQGYATTCFVLQFVLPLLFTTIFYAHICHVLRRRPIKKHDTRRSQRTNRILIAVVLTFTACWLPWNIFALTVEFNQKLVGGKYFRVTDLLLKIFAMGSACVNPFLYGWLNDNFKKELGKMLGYQTLCCRPPGGRLRSDGGLSMGEFSKTTHVPNNTHVTHANANASNNPAAVPLTVLPCNVDTSA